MKILGIDIGGSGIKYGIVDLSGEQPEITGRSVRSDVTFGSPAEEYIRVLGELITENAPDKTVGIAFPTVIRHGTHDDIRSMSRFFPVWQEIYARFVVEKGYRIFCVNDADAAGMAELAGPHGSAMANGVSILLTLGTGIGSAVFVDGRLLPNTEFAYLRMHGRWAEQYMAASVINKESLTMDEWADRLQEYLVDLERIMNPDLILLGGKISDDFDQYKDKIDILAKVLPAHYHNDAGIIGAALNASRRIGS